MLNKYEYFETIFQPYAHKIVRSYAKLINESPSDVGELVTVASILQSQYCIELNDLAEYIMILEEISNKILQLSYYKHTKDYLRYMLNILNCATHISNSTS